MARKKTVRNAGTEKAVMDYRHEEASRTNIPPAGLAAQGRLRETPKMQFAYNPHLPPMLRFDKTGEADRLPELLQTARSRTLNADEAQLLADSLKNQEPWLEWAGKQEKKALEVDPVALHIHERISTQAILKIIAREDIQRDLFADPQLEYHKAVQFYQHDIDWTNRMILGDSLQVMASLAKREGLNGKVQMIYMDPPYGIKFSSNFQSEIGKRDVKDKESDLTREPEMVRAYRDTWTLGVHSYLAYLRDRLILCRELLADAGSIFVQISDENLHRVKCLMDEVFGINNLCGQIHFKSTTSQTSELLASVGDYLLWYSKNRSSVKYRQLYMDKNISDPTAVMKYVEYASGHRHTLNSEERENYSLAQLEGNLFVLDNLTSQSGGTTTKVPVQFNAGEFLPGPGFWKTNVDGMRRLGISNRLAISGNTLRFVRFAEDFPVTPTNSWWLDTSTGSFTETKVYVVQTNTKLISRCLLMTTDPGDLVLDPTGGSGTTAYVSEQWGRRWISIDTSRVAMAIAKQRVLTSTFPFYRVKDGEENEIAVNPQRGFIYRTVPHITLKSIAQNIALDTIYAKHYQILDEKLNALNAALKAATSAIRQKLLAKLVAKERTEGKKSVTDAERRRWQLPKKEWKEWEVPFDTDEDWPPDLKEALNAYRTAWRAKMDEVNACIAANAEQEYLVDQPEVIRGVTRVSGPFTMEAVMPVEEYLVEETPIGGEPEAMGTFSTDDAITLLDEPLNAEAYLDKMLRLLKADGVRFPNNKTLRFARLEPCASSYLHAEGEWETEDGKTRMVAVSFGPQFGSITAYQVEQALPLASRRGINDLVFAGFSFDAAAQAIIQEDPNPNVRCHLAHIRPDVNMGDLLKETPNSQIFTVFGSPRTNLKMTNDGEFIVEMEGVDIYNPVDNTILPTNTDKIAAWFLDTDYDGRTFCITQAFFPDKTAWMKIARALKGIMDEERFSALSGTVSLPFPAGKNKRVAVKVIDPRGNEVMRVHRLLGGGDAHEKA